MLGIGDDCQSECDDTTPRKAFTAVTFNLTEMNISSQTVLWEGSSSDLTSMATAGRVASTGYRVTEDAIHFASGILSSKEEAVPLWAVRDIDLNQGMSQRARGVGDLTLKMDAQAAADYGQRVLVLKAIKDPKQVRSIILAQANEVRTTWMTRQHDRDLEQRRAGANQFGGYQAPAPVQPATAGADDFMARLTKLGEMKQAGLLSDDEFATAKARLMG